MLFEDHAHRGKPMHAFAIMVELGREAFGHTVVVQDRFRLFKSHFGTSGLRRADMVDPIFEKKYDVFTNDQVEARYLIGPDMIEKIAVLHDAALGSEMAIAFKDRASFVFFKGGELGIIPRAVKEGDIGSAFSAGILASGGIDRHVINLLCNELNGVLAFVDYLSIYKPRIPCASV